MKFLCVTCDAVMEYAERQLPGDGTMAVVYGCPACGREIALLTNPMETRLVSGLGIQVGGRSVPDQPMELVRSALVTGGDAFADAAPGAARALQGMEAESLVAVVHAHARADVAHPLDGFGYLVPSSERGHVLGTLFCSSIDPECAPPELVLLLTLLCGSRVPELVERSD